MRVGDVVETAVWLTGEEPKDLRDDYKADVREAISSLCQEKGFVHGPVEFVKKRPGDDRVPPVPNEVQGIDVHLLVAEAKIIGRLDYRSGGFIAELEPRDLERLRQITRRAHRAYLPDGETPRELTDQEVDDIIDELGPEAARDAIRSAYDRGMVH